MFELISVASGFWVLTITGMLFIFLVFLASRFHDDATTLFAGSLFSAGMFIGAMLLFTNAPRLLVEHFRLWWLIAYCVIGVAHAVLRWSTFVYQYCGKLQTQHYQQHGTSGISNWQYEGMPQASQYSSELAYWLMFWPPSLFNWLFADAIYQLFDVIGRIAWNIAKR